MSPEEIIRKLAIEIMGYSCGGYYGGDCMVKGDHPTWFRWNPYKDIRQALECGFNYFSRIDFEKRDGKFCCWARKENSQEWFDSKFFDTASAALCETLIAAIEAKEG